MLYIYTCLIVRLHVNEVKATCLDTTSLLFLDKKIKSSMMHFFELFS